MRLRLPGDGTVLLARTLVGAALAAVVLTACSTPPFGQDENTTDPAAAKAELVTLLEAAQDSIGGEWERSDTGARDCALAGGDGASSLLTRRGPAVDAAKQQATIDAILAKWQQHDVDAVVSAKPTVNDVEVTQLRFPKSGTAAGGFFIEVWISDRASSVTGQTRCASGDAAVINAP